jgi:hypothetical protein
VDPVVSTFQVDLQTKQAKMAHDVRKNTGVKAEDFNLKRSSVH